jgi:fructosamine-3-kinase
MTKISVLIAAAPGAESDAAAFARAQTIPVHEILRCEAADPTDAWREAFLRSTGDVLLFMRGDDALAPDHCEHLLERIAGSHDLGVAFHTLELDDRPHLITTRLLRERRSAGEPDRHDEKSALSELFCAQPLLRRRFVEGADLLGMRTAYGPDPAALWRRMVDGELKVSTQDRALLAGEYAMMAMRWMRLGNAGAARERLRMMHAAASSEAICRRVLLRTALRVAESLEDDDLQRFIKHLSSVMPAPFARHIDALCSAEAGFSAFRAGRLDRAARRLVHAFRGAPQLIGNIGAWSVLGRALLASFGVHRREDPMHAVLQQVGATLCVVPTGVSDTGAGTNANTFVVHLPQGRALLRLLQGEEAPSRADALADLMQRLHESQVRVPRVLGRGVLEGRTRVAWVAEEFITADVSEPWRMRRADAVQLAAEIGRQLRMVHDLPAQTFGASRPMSFAHWLEEELPFEPEAESRLTHDIRVRLMHARDFLLASHPAGPVVLHADLWPGNYLVTPDGEVVLIDWASARGGDAAFDPAIWYMALRDHDLLDRLLAAYAPEQPQLFLQRVHAYADLYAAALIGEKFSNQRIDAARLHAQARRWLDRSPHSTRSKW